MLIFIIFPKIIKIDEDSPISNSYQNKILFISKKNKLLLKLFKCNM